MWPRVALLETRILEGVATHCTGPSQSPEIALFKKFKEFWPKIDVASYQDGPSDETVWEAIEPIRNDTINFVNNQLQKYQPRDDYLELLHLALIFAGEKPASGAKFRRPGALSKARWMMFLIYAFKTWMFRGQFAMTVEQETGLRQLCLFGFSVYIKRWFGASTVPAICPREDLALLHELRGLSKGGHLQAEATAALRKFEGAMWYLSDRLIPLALFDQEVPEREKDLIARAILESQKQPSKKNNRWRRSPTDIGDSTCLADLVTVDSKAFFKIMNLQIDFLSIPARMWTENKFYLEAKNVVDNLSVTNEISERAVAVANEFKNLCKLEENYQNLLLVVYLDRKLHKL
ncbi:Adenine deaminase [Frankliniella fusca]|uniref:Adenine deaminase n=1 Tax=Frankliniella fusca TaxID=407009 RepID=A0AAE1I321_9NEOP|nr:Adenine deaminase [Frankliniella fusca]